MQFTYLGAEFTASGLCKIDPLTLNNKIDILLKAPAKLYMLKNFLLPSFYHSFIFSKIYASYLKKIDIFVMKIFHLHHDLPKADFHA